MTTTLALGLDDDAVREFKRRAWAAIEGLWHLEDPAAVEVRATEQHLSVTLDEVPFQGVVDRVECEGDGVVISDYKSGRAPSARYAADRLQQVLLYAAAVAAETGEQPAKARLLYLGQRVVETPATPDETVPAIERLKSSWHAIADACDADRFEPRPGPLCNYCAYSEQCAEGSAHLRHRAELRAAEDDYWIKLAG